MKSYSNVFAFAATFLTIATAAEAQFQVITQGKPAAFCVGEQADPGVVRAVNDVAADIKAMCGAEPEVRKLKTPPAGERQIIVGVYSEEFMKGLADVRQLKDSTEKHIIKIENDRIIIAGADKRGAIYGVYHLAEMMGISPLSWWADVTPLPAKDLALEKGEYTEGVPVVRYRGIFLNDEWPCLGNWTHEKFGGFNSKFYEHVFSLVLRLRGNFLWPAMWAAAFFDDDPKNGPLANEMGVIMGTSHHEPMDLAQQDWKRRGKGAWNYNTNKKNLQEFWKSGIERSKNWETVVTVGMRGDGDEPMSDDTNIKLLQSIVKDQRDIIKKVTGRPAEETPQVWALYKEVQKYYDHGMRVPDDITLLLCDDNWGDLRRMPKPAERNRKGGYGMYYHVDYVGDPRNSKWANVSQIERIAEQMLICANSGVDRLWVLNVGDLKPMEFPIDFFLRMAWNPQAYSSLDVTEYYDSFAKQNFGEAFAPQVADLLKRYTKYNNRRTAELMAADVYSNNYSEWDRVLRQYRDLELDAQRLAYLMPKNRRDAFDQLLLFPITSMCNIYELYYAQMRNQKAVAEGNAECANRWADRVEECFARDSVLTAHYHAINGGKWNHLMDQTHIGYTYWQQPDVQVMPEVKRLPQPRIARQNVFKSDGKGYVAMEACNFTNTAGGWTYLKNYGRTASSIRCDKPGANAYAEYVFENSEDAASAKLELHTAPLLDLFDEGKITVMVSVDGGKEAEMNILGDTTDDLLDPKWQKLVSERIAKTEAALGALKAGRHTLRVRPVTPNIILERVIVDLGGLKPSYLGPEESPVIKE